MSLPFKESLKTISFIFFLILFVLSFCGNTSNLILSSIWLFFISIYGICKSFKINFSYGHIEKSFVFFTIYLLLQFIFSSPNLAYRHYKFNSLLGYIILFFIFQDFSKNYIIKINRIIYLITIISFIECVVASLQYFDIISPANEYFKISGTLTSPNYLGGFLVVEIISIMWLFMYSIPLQKKIKFVILSQAFLSIIILFITESRTSFLMLIAGALFLFFTSKKIRNYIKPITKLNKLLIVFLGIFTLSFVSLKLYNYKIDSVTGRRLIAKITLDKAIEKPFFGHGIYSFAKEYSKAKINYFKFFDQPWNEIKNAAYSHDAHNPYLLVIFQLGFVGFFLLIQIAYYSFSQVKTKSNEVKFYLSIILVISIACFFMPFTNHVFVIFLLIFCLVNLCKYQNKTFRISSYRVNILIQSSFLIICLFSLYLTTSNYFNLKNVRQHWSTLNNITDKKSKSELSKIYDSVFYNGLYKYNYGLDLFENGFKKEGLAVMEEAIKMNFKPDFIEVLAYLHIQEGNYKRATELFEINIWNEPYKYQPKKNLVELYYRINDLKNAKKISQQIINMQTKIPSKKIDSIIDYSKNVLRIKNDLKIDINGSISDNYYLYSKYLKKGNNYKIYFPNIKYIKEKLPVIYLTDGHDYLKNNFFLRKVDSMIENGSIKPIALVFIDPRDTLDKSKNYRNDYFNCNEDYVKFISEELSKNLEQNYPISFKREDKTILGRSFGGLFSAYLASEAYDNFKNIVMQSPAFHPCPDIYNFFKINKLLDINIYLSYGTGNDTKKQVLPMIRILKEKGYKLKVNKVSGGNHNWNTWKEQINDILLYYYGI